MLPAALGAYANTEEAAPSETWRIMLLADYEVCQKLQTLIRWQLCRKV